MLTSRPVAASTAAAAAACGAAAVFDFVLLLLHDWLRQLILVFCAVEASQALSVISAFNHSAVIQNFNRKLFVVIHGLEEAAVPRLEGAVVPGLKEEEKTKALIGATGEAEDN